MVLHAKGKFRKVYREVKDLLISSCKNGNTRCFALLIAMGADLTVKDDEGRSLMQIAYLNGQVDLVEYMAKYSASIRVNLTKFIDRWNKKHNRVLRGYTGSSAQVMYNSDNVYDNM